MLAAAFVLLPCYVTENNSTGQGLDEKHVLCTGETSNPILCYRKISLRTTSAHVAKWYTTVLASRKNLRPVQHLIFPK